MGKFKKPKVTLITRHGRKKLTLDVNMLRQQVAPGCSASTVPDPMEQTATEDLLQSTIVDIEQASAAHPTTTKHQQYKKKEVESWQLSRDGLLRAAVESWALSKNVCVVCGEQESTTRCLDCGPQYYACKLCGVKDHLLRPFHHREEWEEYMFVKVAHAPVLLIDKEHSCGTKCMQTLTVVDNKGRPVQCEIEHCQCEPLPQRLVKLQLWPSSPRKPNMAFSIQLLELLHLLTLECHISVHGFLETLRWHHGLTNSQVKQLYRQLASECFPEFQFMYSRMSNLETFHPEFTDQNVCPACPQSGKIIAIDGNFGLVRKASSGNSWEPPKHPHKLFIPDDDVSAYISAQDDSTDFDDGECSRFQAGSHVRSTSKTGKLDVTGILGAACRHEIPLLFLNLRHGERFSYPMLLLKSLVDQNKEMRVLYDVACIFKKYLQKREDGKNLSQHLTLALPIFHCYGHQVACQVLMHPRRVEGFGTSDGEWMERIWSYLRPFHKITKEMAPSHRIDLLTHGLVHFGNRKILGLAESLLRRWKDAKTQIANSEKSRHDLLEGFGCQQQVVSTWQDDEIQLAKVKAPKRPSALSNYVIDLKRLFDIQQSPHCSDERTSSIRELETKLKKYELKHTRGIRWEPTNATFQVELAKHEKSSKEKFLHKMLVCARERTFLLGLKKRYTDGQAIANRISQQITSVTKKIKKQIHMYNSQGFSTSPMPNTVTEDEVFHTDSPLYAALEGFSQGAGPIPAGVRREAVDLQYREKSAREEVTLVENEMRNMVDFYLNQHRRLVTVLHNDYSESISAYEKGLKCLLLTKCAQFENMFNHLQDTFGDCIDNFPEMHFMCGFVHTPDCVLDDDDDLEYIELGNVFDSDSD